MNKSYMPVAMFSYKGNKYCIALAGNNICYFKYKNNKMNSAFSDEEIKLFLAVHNSLKINVKNSISLGRKYIDNKQFEIFYDIKKDLHYWYKIENNTRCKTTEEENSKLNHLYNNTRAILASKDVEIYDWANEEEEQQGLGYRQYALEQKQQELEQKQQELELKQKELEIKQQKFDKKKKSNKITRAINTGKATLFITLFAGINLITYSNSTIAVTIKDKIRDIIGIEQQDLSKEDSIEALLEQFAKRPYNYEEVEQAIDSNTNLTVQEKDFIKKMKFVFDENHQYMNMDQVIERLSTLEIEYDENGYVNPEIHGLYHVDKNKICIYYAKNFEEASLNVVVHELMHVLQMSTSNRFTMELSNELFARETLRKMDELGLIENTKEFENSLGEKSIYGLGYNSCMPVEYLLAELLTPEQRKIYQFTTSQDVIIGALEKIDSEGVEYEKLSYQEQVMQYRVILLLNAIDSLIEETEDGTYKMQYTSEKYEYISSILDGYYQKKYGKGVKEFLNQQIIGIDRYNVSNTEYDDVTSNAIFFSIVEKIESEIEDEDKSAYYYIQRNFGKNSYVLPKTYFSDDHENTILMLETPDIKIIEIDENMEKLYLEQRAWVDEQINGPRTKKCVESEYETEDVDEDIEK